MSCKQKLVLLGLDGLDPYHVKISPLIMPSLARLVTRGSYAMLRSTMPPGTIPAWITIATGLEPRTLGIQGGFLKRSHNYTLRPLSITEWNRYAFWTYLNKLDLHVGVAFWPFLYPVPHIRAFAISGYGAPKLDFYPKYLNELVPELNDVTTEPVRKLDLLIKQAEVTAKVITKLLEHYFEKDKIVLFASVFSFTDHLFHQWGSRISQWRTLNNVMRRVKEFFQIVDALINEVAEISVANDALLLILSDHGHAPLTKRRVAYLPIILHRCGLLRIKPSGLLKILLKEVSRLLARPLTRFITNPESLEEKITPRPTEVIDLPRSLVFTLDHGVFFGAIYLNLRDRDPQGVIRREHAKGILNLVVKRLRQYKLLAKCNIVLDASVDEKGPDIIIYTLDIVLLNNIHLTYVFSKSKSVHDLHGVFIAFGTNIKSRGGKLKTDQVVHISRVCPTIYYHLRTPLPPWIKDEPLVEIFQERHPIVRLTPQEYLALGLLRFKRVLLSKIEKRS